MYVYIMECYSQKNEIQSFAAMWMDLENIIEIKQRKTNIGYHLYVEYKENNTNEGVCKTKTESQI